MGKFDTGQLSIILSPDPNWLGPQQLIASSEYPHPFSDNKSITHHTTRALQIATLVLNMFGPVSFQTLW